MQQGKPEVFEIVRSDQWGNQIVRCPVCGDEFKEDGVKKHIYLQARAEDRVQYLPHRGHREWIDDGINKRLSPPPEAPKTV